MDTANAANAGAERGHSRRTGRLAEARRQTPLEEPPVGGPPLCDLRRHHNR